MPRAPSRNCWPQPTRTPQIKQDTQHRPSRAKRYPADVTGLVASSVSRTATESTDFIESPLATKLCQDLQLEFPVVAFSHCRDVVAAVSNAGGLGILGAVRFTAEELELELRWLDEHTVRYGVDVLLPSSKVGLSLEEHAAAIPEEHKAFVGQLQGEAGVDMGPDAAPALQAGLPGQPGIRDG